MRTFALLAALAAGFAPACALGANPDAPSPAAAAPSIPVTVIGKASPPAGPVATPKPAVIAPVVPAPDPIAAAPAKPAEPAGSTPAPVAAVPAPDKTPVDKIPVDKAAVDKPAPPAPPSLVVKIDLTRQRLEVHAAGTPRHSWAISSGAPGYPTPRGTFKAQWMARMWYSKKYDLAPMPHSVFFHGGAAIHATSSTHLLGRPASHGCVRLAPSHAAQLYALVTKHGLARTQITVFGHPPAPAVAQVRPRAPRVAVDGPASAPVVSRYPGARPGMVFLRPGSAHYGADSFVHNGIRYVRVR